MKRTWTRFLPGVVALVTGLAMAPPASAPLGAQARAPEALPARAPEARPRFEVATVKPNASGEARMQMVTRPGGVFVAVNAPLKLLIADAYIGAQPGAVERILGGPEWVQSARYDINAKAAAEFRATPPGPPAEMLLMIRSLLEDRFTLRVHRETRESPAYELVLARPGVVPPGLRKSDVDCDALLAAWQKGGLPQIQPGGRADCRFNGGPGGLTVGAQTMVQFTQFLQRIGRPVIDKTGLTGRYDFDLKFAPLGPPAAGAAGDPSLPTIFIALEEQLGLKLQSTNGPLEVFVIDAWSNRSQTDRVWTMPTPTRRPAATSTSRSPCP
jgi:uncharacterized protein (TIGR03435 family)